MNSNEECHTILDCPGLYVDGFRGRLLQKTSDVENGYILSHYHGDHYQQLPRDGKYQGPASIYCTPITRLLLIHIHQVPSQYVIAHEYGQTWEYRMKKNMNGKQQQSEEVAQITFYDANHCPGACIILIQLPNGTTHLHTGDMRYHRKFQSYPLLRQIVQDRKLDLVYLDTTYSHPKHDFSPQEDVIKNIASQTESLLKDSNESNTLIMLSCYSIGKEKVLWEASLRTDELIFVTDKKYKMLQCIQQGHNPRSQQPKGWEEQKEEDPSSSSSTSTTTLPSVHDIIQRCTKDPSKSNIHVIPMGLAGDVHPFFRPNFQKCGKYVEKLDLTDKYDRVVAFIPTGWANSSKWNKEHSCEMSSVELSNGKMLEVEVRLICYSEHSAWPEIVEFVSFLKPRKVIPTVFSNDTDRRNIENRFRNMLDLGRAKKKFFRSMEKAANELDCNNKNKQKGVYDDVGANSKKTKKENGRGSNAETGLEGGVTARRDVDDKNDDDEIIEVVAVVKSPSNLTTMATSPQHAPRLSTDGFGEKICTLVSMGFGHSEAKQAVEKCDGDLERTVEKLLSHNSCINDVNGAANQQQDKLQGGGNSIAKRKVQKQSSEVGTIGSASNKKQKPISGSSLITNFFAKKKGS